MTEAINLAITSRDWIGSAALTPTEENQRGQFVGDQDIDSSSCARKV